MLLLMLVACKGPPTDTYPSFYGEVPKNIIMISVDTYRRDYMARYGGDPTLTPFMDQLASESVVLDDHRSCSNWTFTSGVCMMNGRYNLDDNFVPKIESEYIESVPNRPTLAGHLSDNGFYTIMITSNSWFSSDYNSDYGYDYSQHPPGDGAWGIYEIGRDKLADVIDQEDPERWMLHLHFKEPHSPYAPPTQYLDEVEELEPIDYLLNTKEGHDAAKLALNSVSEEERELLLAHFEARYRGEMRYMDDLLERIWTNMKLHGLLKDSLVVFWSDHGEAFWEHGKLTHAYYLNKEENDAISFFWGKDIIADEWPEPTSHIDLAATILKLYNIEVPEEDLSGVPLSEAQADRPLFGMSTARAGPVQSVMIGPKMLQYRWAAGEFSMFDSTNDPKQQTNIFDQYNAETMEMWDLLEPKIHQMIPLVPEYTPVEPEFGWSPEYTEEE